MTNPIKDFFRRHHAVPANDAGPQWDQASEEALLAWFQSLAAIVRCGWNREGRRNATQTERQGSLPVYNAVVAEIHRRAQKPNASSALMGAHFRALLPFEAGT